MFNHLSYSKKNYYKKLIKNKLKIYNQYLENIKNNRPASVHHRRRYSDFFQFAPVGYFTFDRTGVILEANSTGALLLGTDRDRLLNKPFFDFISPESEKVFELHSRRIIDSRTLHSCDLKLSNHH